MAILVERVSGIPHGGSMYIEREPGEQAGVWLDADLFTAGEADILARQLSRNPGLLLTLAAIV